MTTTTSDHTVISAAAQHREYSVPEHRITDKPVRILHVLGGMDRGGVETWLMHVLRNIDRQQFHMDFLVHTDRRCAYDDEIEALGSSIYYCPRPSNPLQYAWNFRRILREQGPYDVVHSHVHHFSGFVLRLARAAGVKQRIAHSHTNTAASDSRSPWHRRLYLDASRNWIRRHASIRLGASVAAAESLFGTTWRSDACTSVLYCGIDFHAFKEHPDRKQVREEFGFAADDIVLGHVGRFVTEKNHVFLVHIHAEVLKIEPKARLLLVGKGPLEQSTHALTERLGTSRFVRFAGVRDDVPRLMLGAMDIFVFPSLHEGLGLVALEAQAAGLPCLVSEGVPYEVDCGCGLLQIASLQSSPGEWANKILHHRRWALLHQADVLRSISGSHFNINASTQSLCELYATAAESGDNAQHL
jgi:glycosyltransferase involved in cell wall biosynthesis